MDPDASQRATVALVHARVRGARDSSESPATFGVGFAKPVSEAGRRFYGIQHEWGRATLSVGTQFRRDWKKYLETCPNVRPGPNPRAPRSAGPREPRTALRADPRCWSGSRSVRLAAPPDHSATSTGWGATARRAAARDAGLSLEDMASHMRVSKEKIDRFEKGRTRPHDEGEVVAAYASICGIPEPRTSTRWPFANWYRHGDAPVARAPETNGHNTGGRRAAVEPRPLGRPGLPASVSDFPPPERPPPWCGGSAEASCGGSG